MNTKNNILVVIVFSIAMAALESAVVVYLRALYYPGEFTVAFKLIDEKILLVELTRELATLFMLTCVGLLAGKNSRERMAFFLLAFAVWDIFYYTWLKVFINWPASLFDWDILFLIPITWLGPVLAPVICSFTMIALAFVLLRTDMSLSRTNWTLLIGGSALILYSFMEDYAGMLITHGFLYDYSHILQNQEFLKIATGYIPASFNWYVFSVGEIFILGGIFLLSRGYATVTIVKESVG
jgi:hypothetical protein